jgi:T5orf172 domain
MSVGISDWRIFGLRMGIIFRPFGRPRRHRAAPRRDRGGGTFLYVLQGKHGLTKIGVSTNPNARLRQLRTASAFPIDFAFVAATPGTGFDIERKAHATLAPTVFMGNGSTCPPEPR